MQCTSSLSPRYCSHNLTSIRQLREDDEKVRLDELMKYDIPHVRCKETLFKKHCSALEKVQEILMSKKDEQRIIIDCLDGCWGQWLQMKHDEINSEVYNDANLHGERSH